MTSSEIQANVKFFLNAGATGDIDLLEKCLLAGIDINARGYSDARDNDYFDSYDDCRSTALSIATDRRQAKAVEYLVCKGADVNLVVHSMTGSTALTEAAYQGSSEIMAILIKNGADINVKRCEHLSVMHEALSPYQGKTVDDIMQCITLLLDNGLDIETGDEVGNTALHEAAGYNSIPLLQLLLDRGANINATKWGGETPLDCAARRPSYDTVSFLLQKGASVNFPSDPPDGCRGLGFAARNGHLAIAQLLLSHGAKPLNLPRPKFALFGGELLEAIRGGSKEIVDLLLSHGFGRQNGFALRRAARFDSSDTVRMLLDIGAPINDRTKNAGRTPLHLAVDSRQVARVHGVENPRIDVVRLLVERGVDYTVTDGDGRSAEDLARQLDYPDAVALLEEVRLRRND